MIGNYAIENIFEFVRNGASIKQEDGKSGIPITRIETIWNSYIDNSRFGFADIPEEELGKYEKYLLKEGDILMTHINSPKHLGKCAIYENEPLKLIHGMNLLCLRPNVNKLFPKYAHYYFNSGFFKSILPKISNQSVNQASFSAGNLKKIQIPLPPLSTQKKIAAILDAADEYRQKTKTLIEKQDQLAQSLFLDMFGDPVTNPMGWEKTTIGESCYFVKDGPHVSPKYVESGIPFISVNNIIKGYWDLGKVRYISKEDHEIFKKRCNPEKGDILYTKGGTTGFAKYIDIDLEFTNWVHLAVLKFDKSILNGKFLEAMLNSQYCYIQSQRSTRGIANRDLVLGQMKKIVHLLPPTENQTQFADRIQLIEQQKQQAQASLQKADDLFNSLLQRAFSNSSETLSNE